MHIDIDDNVDMAISDDGITFTFHSPCVVWTLLTFLTYEK